MIFQMFPKLTNRYHRANKFLFWAVVAGFITIFPVLYIPGLNDFAFKHTGISWVSFHSGLGLFRRVTDSFFRNGLLYSSRRSSSSSAAKHGSTPSGSSTANVQRRMPSSPTTVCGEKTTAQFSPAISPSPVPARTTMSRRGFRRAGLSLEFCSFFAGGFRFIGESIFMYDVNENGAFVRATGAYGWIYSYIDSRSISGF